jgi:hypothetical protein
MADIAVTTPPSHAASAIASKYSTTKKREYYTNGESKTSDVFLVR